MAASDASDIILSMLRFTSHNVIDKARGRCCQLPGEVEPLLSSPCYALTSMSQKNIAALKTYPTELSSQQARQHSTLGSEQVSGLFGRIGQIITTNTIMQTKKEFAVYDGGGWAGECTDTCGGQFFVGIWCRL